MIGVPKTSCAKLRFRHGPLEGVVAMRPFGDPRELRARRAALNEDCYEIVRRRPLLEEQRPAAIALATARVR